MVLMNSKDYIRKFLSEDTDFPGRLISARKKANFTKTELAKQIGVNKSLITNYENGVRYPTDENIYALAKVLNVTPNYLKYGFDTVEFEIGDGLLISHYHRNHDPRVKGLMFSSDPKVHFYHSEEECIKDINECVEYLKSNKDFELLSALAEIAFSLKSHHKVKKDIEKTAKKSK